VDGRPGKYCFKKLDCGFAYILKPGNEALSPNKWEFRTETLAAS
jgi:hypothetical protein